LSFEEKKENGNAEASRCGIAIAERKEKRKITNAYVPANQGMSTNNDSYTLPFAPSILPAHFPAAKQHQSSCH
jgi:hypothetical protein